MIIQSITSLGSGNYSITFTKSLSLISIEAGDPIRSYEQYTTTGDLSRGDYDITFSQSPGTSIIGAYLVFYDTNKAGDVVNNPTIDYDDPNGKMNWYSNNLYKLETRRVVSKSGSTVRLNEPLSNDFTASSLKLVRLTPNESQFFDGQNNKIMMIEEPDVNVKQNNHFLMMNRSVGSAIRNIVFSDSDEAFRKNSIQIYPNKDNCVRLRESYMCSVDNVTISRYNNNYSYSAQSYGITSYYNSFCSFTNIANDTLRHNLLLQGGDNCIY